MRVLVVVAHPNQQSYTRAVASAAVQSLTEAGHSVTELDLYALGFRAAMSADERRAYHGEQPVLDPLVTDHIAALKQADALVFVYPTWWSSMPAILKGWLERVMVPGVGFTLDDQHRVRPALTNVCRIVGISTYGSPWPVVKFVNDNGRRTINRALRVSTGFGTRASWMALYAIDTTTPAERQAFIDKVARKLAAL